ncbi:sensor histidine kinase [Haloflavibacter putidus]|uniref:histidine kinase n=1 Tax=Haloflavibacter putidus TaxID=2576776 RepID=A0A507ZNH9_9FLAO|nr:HAMP domain-containing sensor histidine kinase [Haloflavibacter putidus]TQD38547.1 HAMP domain-containing histidine kinase [Haloflavibacter putidus]
MVFSDQERYTRWFITISSIIIVALFLWNVFIFFNRIKQEERDKMEIWVSAYSQILQSSLDDEISVELKVIEKNTSTPMIIYSLREDTYDTRNIAPNDVDTKEEIEKLVASYQAQNKPIEVTDQGDLLSIIYYGNSELLTKLKYFPAGIVLVVILFLAMLYYFYTTSKTSEQNKLWAGMAKETAHQIGTPLSSLVGWTEILKSENVDKSYLQEMEKDINRLKTITERFSKIGSLPTLKETNIVEATKQSYDYLKARNSRLIEFSISLPSHPIMVKLNEQLYSWTIENLVKNAIDALRGKGKINLEITEDQKWVKICLSDNGKGIPKSNYKKIFTPGYTTKKRGWGLGLSLAKRIIEDYHNGKIRVLKSETNKGTTFEIKLLKC